MNRHDKREPRHLLLTRDLTISFLLLFKTSCAIPLYPAADYGSFLQLGSDSRFKSGYYTFSPSVCTLARLTHSLTTKQSCALATTVSNRRDSSGTQDYFISNSKN